MQNRDAPAADTESEETVAAEEPAAQPTEAASEDATEASETVDGEEDAPESEEQSDDDAK